MSKITREEAITIIDNLHLIGCGRNQHEDDLKINVALDMAIEALKNKPQGEWKPKNNHTDYCSNCGFEEVHWRTVDYDYCPNCNAEMRCE